MPELRHGDQVGDDRKGFRVVEVVSLDGTGNAIVVGFAVLDPDLNEVWRGVDLDEAFRQRDEFAGPSTRGPSGPSM